MEDNRQRITIETKGGTSVKERTIIQTKNDVVFKLLMVMMLRERMASITYDYTLEGDAARMQNSKLDTARREIVDTIRHFLPGELKMNVISQAHGDLSNPAPAVNFAARGRSEQHFQYYRLEMPFELWNLGEVVNDALV